MVTFNLSRSASMFESGIGRGMGFRDSNQDLLGFVHMIPERARARILDIAATQLPDGGAYHQYQPLTKRGNHDVGSGLQRRPGVARAGRSRPTSRRPATWRSSTSPCRGTTSAGSETPLHDHLRRCIDFTLEPARPARAAAHRAGGLERLPQPQRLLRPARRVLPDGPEPARRRRRVRVHRRPLRAGRARGRGDRPVCAATRPEATRCRAAAAADDRGHRGARLGRGLVPAGVRPRRERGRVGRERRGPDLHRAAGADGDGRRRPRRRAHPDRDRIGPRAAGDAARDRAPAAGLRDATTSSSARSRRTRRATRRTPASSATRTRG